MVLILGAGGYVVARYLGERLPLPLSRQSCTVTADGVVSLNAEQLDNAATIAAVGIRRRLPERAIVIALATAYQESKIRNLPGGDRDSVGLFQQRPSQGWGTAEQISDPRYAVGRFYDKLIKVSDWEQLRITEAAQAVQVSAYPELYERWVSQSEILAKALRGVATQAVTCTLLGEPAQRGTEALQGLLRLMKLDWGLSATSETGTLVMNPPNTQIGWQYAHWLVARADGHGVRAVQFAGMEWTAKQGTWVKSASAAAAIVTASVYP
jgi:hypothetical protein